ncbi:hypothetical protein [Streptomyces sp. NPDC002851]
MWRSSAQDAGESGVQLLAGTLRRCADAFAPDDFATRALLHIQEPQAMPLPLFATVQPAYGEREEALRALVRAEDPDAVEPPVVEAHRAEFVGQGLRAFRSVRQDDDPELLAGLRYAWRDDEFAMDIVLWTATTDIGQIMQATDRIEQLTQKVAVRVRGPEPEGPAAQ